VRKLVVGASILLGLAAVALPVQEQLNSDDSKPGLTIFVHMSVPAGERSIHRAEREAAYLLGKSGLEVVWINCLPGRERNPRCDAALTGESLVLRVAARPPATYHGEPFGTAVAGGNYASVYTEPVAALVKEIDSDYAQVLGDAMAHEIGHLLLGPGSHSPHGIMKALWGRKDVADASRRSLRFTADQGERMRAALAARQARTPDLSGEVALASSAAQTPTAP
jgi:hypothetical protein